MQETVEELEAKIRINKIKTKRHTNKIDRQRWKELINEDLDLNKEPEELEWK